jgi:hypothetical protein
MQKFLKANLTHILAVATIVLLACAFTLPVFSGKQLVQHDSVQAAAGAKELVDYHARTGTWQHWTNSMFGGMPAYMIAGDYPNSLGTKLGRWATSWLPSPANILAVQMLCMYLLLLVLRCRPWLSVLGAVAYGFGCYTLVFIEAGHISKIVATAFAPLVWAGVILCMRERTWLGAALLAVGMALELYGNHLQITYFLAITIVVYVLWESIGFVKAGNTVSLLKTLGIMAIAGAIGASTHASRLMTSAQYSKETTRGKSELTIAADSSQASTKPADGLNRDYAFSWSHGVAESLTLLVPGFYGGASGGGLGQQSATYKAMTEAGIDPAAANDFAKNSAPLYWGSQQLTAGPAYAGAIVLFLFVLGLFLLKGDLKWYLLVISTLLLAFAWGSNFSWFNYLMFDYFPLFNKFRDNKMVLILLEMFLATGAILTLKQILDEKPSFETIRKPLYISLSLTAGLALLLGLGGSVFFDFNSSRDTSMEQMVGSKEIANSLVLALKADRASLLRTDSLRTAFLILAAALVLFLFLKNKLNEKYSLLAIGLLLTADLFFFNKRYLNAADFVSKSVANETFVPSPADEYILQDKALSYRVADFSTNFWSEARPSYYHKSVSGYHGAKLKRTQELFDFQIAKNNMEPLNMLNVKYFITADEKGNQVPQLNPQARGNAWFVKNYEIVPNANAEIKALDSLKTNDKAVVDSRFADQLKGLQIAHDSSNTIKLTSYSPDKLSYQSNAKTDQLAVFSEIYYRGNIDWKAYIDGNETPHLRANYVLRAMRIPAGSHKVDFVFAPSVYKTGNTIDLLASVLLLALVAVAGYISYKE